MAEASVAEILKKVQKIQIAANRAVDDLFAGAYHAVFRGRGMEFDEVREYQPGDDVRSIDWNVTARSGAPFVKRFREERELTVLFVVDVSASQAFGSGQRAKLDVAVEVAALLMFSALKNNDKVGLLTFCDDVLRYFPPRKGKATILRLLRELIAADPVARETRIERALEYLSRVQRRRAVVFLVSDFQGPDCRKALQLAHARHDLVAIRVGDPREAAVPPAGILRLRDAETGEVLELDTASPRVRELFRARAAGRVSAASDLLRRAGVDELAIDTAGDYVKSMHRFFRMRERRQR